ncbi:(2Fe-2S)-binding protein [Bacillus sp. FJAT-29790]|uniref:(2Fe-2S)-binding protein n=1 Tax=Bacillus sp. FJAT-29790 TaxID=1895002 RepID=UPI001C22BE48|nr:(2Fe-2S)-binding protein [Bacillus sp. FJAT-29790]MBU8878439.1 (2Fe-2S)-binding protein [Bacillus sp. FJAT-29790]
MDVTPLKKLNVPLHINGEIYHTEIRPASTLLSVLREQLALNGAKPGCLNGDCGACTIIMDETPYKSCIMLAIEAVEHKIITIEGLINTPIQKAFIEHFAFQCGYCTPGFIMNCQALLTNHPNPNQETIREWLASNICRCTSYEEIENAVKSVIQFNTEPRSE